MREKPTKFRAKRSVIASSVFAAAAGLTVGTVSASAQAQQQTFTLDRLQMPGAPDDGIALFRPVTEARNILFGQIGLGYSLRPLRTSNVTNDANVISRSRSTLVQDQFQVYANAGFQLLDRVTLGVAFPFTPIQDGGNPDYGVGSVLGPGTTRTTLVKTGGPSAGDMRVDLRGVIARSEDRKSAFGAHLSVFAPTGTTTNFGGDVNVGAALMVEAEHTIKFITLVANTGLQFRPRHVLNDPAGPSGGLGIGDEWRWSVGAFVPVKDGKYRLGATIFGQTGIESDNIIGSTAFTKHNTPIEFEFEGRMRLGPADHWWLGAGAGSSILRGYGAPDLRVVALLGAYVPILDSEAKSPERRAEVRARWRQEHTSDRDGDGIPDDIDACPDQPEDHLGADPNDGCPLPPDRDHDGIPDQFDKCPDEPEDKDGIDDGDGCPETDADNDGILDTQDACPKVPGKPNADPKKNGCPTTFTRDENSGVIRVLQQVHFAFGTATILPESNTVLSEIGDLLRASKGIKKMSIEGHTDNRGAADLNKKLSQARANAVMAWLTSHGIEGGRLEAHGYGMEQPIRENDTDAGRAANRRVEFKILEEEDTNKVQTH